MIPGHYNPLDTGTGVLYVLQCDLFLEIPCIGGLVLRAVALGGGVTF